MLLVAGEKLLRPGRGRSSGRNAIDRRRRTGRNVQPTLRVECHIPNVLRLVVSFRGVEHNLGLALIDSRLTRMEPIHFATRQSRRVDRTIRPHAYHLHGKIFALEQLRLLAVRTYLQHRRRTARRDEHVILLARSNRPYICRSGRHERLQRRGRFQVAFTRNSHTVRRALFKFFVVRL